MNLFDKLLMMRELKFETGNISLLNQRVLLQSNQVFIPICKILDTKKDLVKDFYKGIRESHIEGWATAIREKYRMDSYEYLNFMVEVSKLAGWGITRIGEFNPKKLEGQLITENSPIGSELKGVVSAPVDHIWRSLAAGVMSGIFQKEIDIVEVKCVALGDSFCEINFFQRGNTPKRIIEKFGYQIGLD